MADTKISDLPAANPLDGSEILEIVQSGVNKLVSIAEIAAEIEALGQYSQLVGDGSNVNITVTHNLNTRELHVTTRRATTPWDEVIVDNEATTVNSITLKFGAIAPASNSFRVTVSK